MHDNDNNPIGVALIGYGIAGKIFHAPFHTGIPGLHLSHVVSSNPAKVHADLPEADVYPTIDDVLANPSVDLVVAATPNDTHYVIASRALSAGKHVVVDKPFTVTLHQAKEQT